MPCRVEEYADGAAVYGAHGWVSSCPSAANEPCPTGAVANAVLPTGACPMYVGGAKVLSAAVAMEGHVPVDVRLMQTRTTHASTHPCIHTHRHACAHARTHSHMHPHAHARTRAHAHTHAPTQPHLHASINGTWMCLTDDFQPTMKCSQCGPIGDQSKRSFKPYTC